MANEYDVLVVGAGLAGLTAGMYAARYGLNTGVVEQMMGGAQIINLEKIENFPGFPEGISGAELGPATQEQAMNAGAEFLMAEAEKVSLDGDHKVVSTDAGDLRAKAVIVAAGSTLRKLGIPGEEEFYGRGVSHCATCDGPLYMGSTVGVVGGGDSAADEALTLTDYADRVLLFHRRSDLRAQQALQDRLPLQPQDRSHVEHRPSGDPGRGYRHRRQVPQPRNQSGGSGWPVRRVRVRRSRAQLRFGRQRGRDRQLGPHRGRFVHGDLRALAGCMPWATSGSAPPPSWFPPPATAPPPPSLPSGISAAASGSPAQPVGVPPLGWFRARSVVSPPLPRQPFLR